MMVLEGGPLKTAAENNDGVIKQELINYRIVDGMLYKNTICKIDTLKEDKLRVQDRSGKLWWVSGNQVSASFL